MKICEFCGSKNMLVQVPVVIVAPASIERKPRKIDISKKEVQLISAIWDKANYYCGDCLNTIGYIK